MPNTKRKVPDRSIPVLLWSCCTEWDNREVQVTQDLRALVLSLIQGWCTVALVCLFLGAVWESFLPVCTSVYHTTGPTSASIWLPLWSKAKSLRTSLTSGSCAAASQKRMGHVWGSTPLKGKNISSDVQQDRETAEISSPVITVFLYVFLTPSHVLRRTLGADQVALRIWNTSQACAFNSPDHLYVPWAPPGAILCNAVIQSKCWDCNAPAGCSPNLGFSTIICILHEPDSEDFTVLWQLCTYWTALHWQSKKKKIKACYFWLWEPEKS